MRGRGRPPLDEAAKQKIIRLYRNTDSPVSDVVLGRRFNVHVATIRRILQEAHAMSKMR